MHIMLNKGYPNRVNMMSFFLKGCRLQEVRLFAYDQLAPAPRDHTATHGDASNRDRCGTHLGTSLERRRLIIVSPLLGQKRGQVVNSHAINCKARRCSPLNGLCYL